MLALAAGAARADGFQQTRYRRDTLLAVGWEVAVPSRQLRDYVRDPGYRGLQLEVRQGIGRSISLGLATSWSWLAQTDPSHAIPFEDATVTGPVYQRARFATLRATAHWYPARGEVQPYLGIGAGALSWETYRMLGASAEKRSGWAPALDPQLGLLWTLSRGAAVHLQARYQYSTARFLGVRDASWLGFELGLAAY